MTSAGEPASSRPRPGPADATPAADEGAGRRRSALRAVALGVIYVALVVALVLAGRAGKGFVYQGF